MPIANQEEHDPTLPPPGSRWGAGAQSVLPYLTRSLQAKPSTAAEQAREHKPGGDTRAAERSSSSTA